MNEFEYIIQKIKNAEFEVEPFKHIYIEDFLSQEHFEHIVNLKEINLPTYNNDEELIAGLLENNYSPVPFPGCTVNIDEYLQQRSGKKIKFKKSSLIEGVGISFRMNLYNDSLLKNLVEFLNSNIFLTTLKEKFEKLEEVTVETAIQKYVSGYEISPHPDIRKKCLTYMANINPSTESENLNFHTCYLKFKEKYKEIYNFWKDNLDIDRCWVPWNWAEVVKKQNKNNSIVIFAPDFDTLHAVIADYDHLKTQRTQIYGNLWYTREKIKNLKGLEWISLEKEIQNYNES